MCFAWAKVSWTRSITDGVPPHNYFSPLDLPPVRTVLNWLTILIDNSTNSCDNSCCFIEPVGLASVVL